jgi:hypothetical protein
MQPRLSHICEEFSLLARMFRLATWAVTQASCLFRRTGILACRGTSRLRSQHDVSGWKPKLG